MSNNDTSCVSIFVESEAEVTNLLGKLTDEVQYPRKKLKIIKKTYLLFILIRYIVLRTMKITQVECAKVNRDLNILMVS